MLTKSLSCNEISREQLPPELCASSQMSNGNNSNNYNNGPALAASKRHKSNDKLTKGGKNENHKTVIYFGDSISSKKQHNQLQQQMRASSSSSVVNPSDRRSLSSIFGSESSDIRHAKRLCDEMVFKRQQKNNNNNNESAQNSSRHLSTSDHNGASASVTSGNVKVMKNDQPNNLNMVKHLKTVLEEKCQQKNDKSNSVGQVVPGRCLIEKDRKAMEIERNVRKSNAENGNGNRTTDLPSFVESVVNGVINIKIDGSYDAATRLVQSIENADTDDGDTFDTIDDRDDFSFDIGGEMSNIYFDWSFVQDWRSR